MNTANLVLALHRPYAKYTSKIPQNQLFNEFQNLPQSLQTTIPLTIPSNKTISHPPTYFLFTLSISTSQFTFYSLYLSLQAKQATYYFYDFLTNYIIFQVSCGVYFSTRKLDRSNTPDRPSIVKFIPVGDTTSGNRLIISTLVNIN